MTTIQVEIQVSPEELLKAVKQLDHDDLDKFVAEVLVHKAKRHAPTIPKPEAELLNIINRDLPSAFSERYNELIEKRRDEVLSSQEHAELLQLSEQGERFGAERVSALAQLAELRHISLPALMDELGIHATLNA